MPEGKRVKIQVKTVRSSYEGYLLIPQMRKRVSDVLNEEERLFINLTDVRVEGGGAEVPFVSLNKNLIESIIEPSD
ncbi:MAG TPA: hypothetical protein VIK48_02970 [Candidatus Manganitrophaceae bacterium]|nr:hypothetical protein [Candidatus Manganitrophaceae bacterium]